MTDAPVLPWRRRAPRSKPDGFVTPRERFAASPSRGSTNGGTNGASYGEALEARNPEASERIPFNRVQARAAVALLASKHTAAHAHTLVACDYSPIMTARERHGEAFRTDEGFSLTALPLIAVAVARALRAHPQLNATIAPDGDAVTVHRRIGLGIAVDLGHQGLVVPTVRDADALSVRGMARAISDLASRARAKQLKPDDLGGGTFSISNPGGYGTYQSFPIIHQPQVAILATDGVQKRVVAHEAGGLEIRPIGHLCLSFDQRVVDVTLGAAFLATLQRIVETEDWTSLL